MPNLIEYLSLRDDLSSPAYWKTIRGLIEVGLTSVKEEAAAHCLSEVDYLNMLEGYLGREALFQYL